MDLLKDDVKKIYFRYLLASFGSAIVSSIYSLVDLAVVGQYHGPIGSAALAVVAPIWNIIYSLGLLFGIGGSVIMSLLKGEGKDSRSRNEYFTIAIICSSIFALICWILFFIFEDNILIFFGANSEEILALAKEYLLSIKYVLPLFLFNQMLAAFLRNDNDPLLATIAVLSGGLFNVFGDIFFVFALDMAIFGAGLATSIGSLITFIVLLIHFFKKKNTYRLVKFSGFFYKFRLIFINGFSTFFIDAAMGIITILFNRQIMLYLNDSALAIYSVIIQISTFVQCLAYAVGQASQPLISLNYGAKNYKRINTATKYAFVSVFIIALIWTSFSLVFPNAYTYLFMSPTEEVLILAPHLIRRYALSFILLPFNIFYTYLFQSISRSKTSFAISIFRSFILSGSFILLLPLINVDLLFYAMTFTEIIVFIFASIMAYAFFKKERTLLTA